MNKKLKFTESYPDKSILIDPKSLPVYSGNDSENLLCGGCSTMLIKGISEKSMTERFVMPSELFIKCPKCGGYNYVPTKILKITTD